MSSLSGELTKNFEFDNFDPTQLQFDPALGMMTVAAEGEAFKVVGFHAHNDPGVDQIEVKPRLSERPADQQGLDDNAKGVGVVLGNTLESIVGPGQGKRTAGLWISESLQPSEVLWRRSRNPESLTQIGLGIGRHLGRIIQSKVQGVEETVASIERPYGDSKLVIINPAPKWLLLARLAGRSNNQVTPAWALYRSNATLRRIGHLTSKG